MFPSLLKRIRDGYLKNFSIQFNIWEYLGKYCYLIFLICPGISHTFFFVWIS